MGKNFRNFLAENMKYERLNIHRESENRSTLVFLKRGSYFCEEVTQQRIIFHEWKKRKERNGTVKHEKFARRQIYLLL